MSANGSVSGSAVSDVPGSCDPNLDPDGNEHDLIVNLPPGRMNAVKSSSSHRLTSNSSGTLPTKPVSTSDNSRSRSKSPSIKTSRTHRSTVTDNSSMSSLEDYFDQDLLTDRAGLEELDASQDLRKMHNSREFNLPPVNERMTEDTLEDVHAFSDVPRSSNASRANSLSVQGELALQPLDECDEEVESDLEDDETPHPAIILTNMENLTLQSEASAGAATVSSLIGEAPSAPTA